MSDALIRELEVAGSQHLGAALLVMLPSGTAVCIAAIDQDRQRRLDEALGMQGWLVGMITFDYQGSTGLVAVTQAFDPAAAVRLRELARRLLDVIAQWRLFPVRLLG